MTTRKLMGETFLLLVHGYEAMLSIEIGVPSLRKIILRMNY